MLTMSRGSGVAFGVADVTMSQQADGLLSNVIKSGAGGDGSMALESSRRRDWDSEAVHPRTVRRVTSRQTHHSWSVRHRRCVHVVERRVVFSLPQPHGEELLARAQRTYNVKTW